MDFAFVLRVNLCLLTNALVPLDSLVIVEWRKQCLDLINHVKKSVCELKTLQR
jgi:hypothetical protein